MVTRVGLYQGDEFFNAGESVLFQTSISIWYNMIRLRLLNSRQLFPLHALHNKGGHTRALYVFPAVYLVVVDCDMLVKAVVPLEPQQGGSHTGLPHL